MSVKASEKSTRNEIISMGGANFVATGLQFLLPVVLVRLLDVTAFGEYRMFWLLASTVMLIAPFGMPRSLHYFLPRVDAKEKAIYIYQTLLFLSVSGLIGAALLAPFNPLLPETVLTVLGDDYVVTTFLFLWVVSSLIEVLPAADQRVVWQSQVVIWLAVLRAIAVISIAWGTKKIAAVFVVLLIFAFVKVALLGFYIWIYHGKSAGNLRSRHHWKEQLWHAIPFGFTGMLNKMRPVTEQWVVAFLFGAAEFAAFSLAAGLIPLLNVLKKTIGFVTLPKMSKFQEQGDYEKLLSLNNKGNLAVAFVMFPVLVVLFVYARQVVEVLYTNQYTEAVDVLRVYIVGIAVMCVDVSSVLIVFRQGRYVVTVSSLLVMAAIIISYSAAGVIGLQGAAVGSVFAMYASSLLYYRRSAALLNVGLRHLQDWRALSVILASAISGGVLSAQIIRQFTGIGGALVSLLLGAAIICVVYLGLIVGMKEGWLLRAVFRGDLRR